MTNQPILKKDHIPELQLVRALAILGVLSVHASASAIVYMKESAYYYFYNFINIFMRFGTPTFILLSSFVLFYSYYSRPLDGKLIASFYKRRMLYILLPYVLFSAIYFIYLKMTYGAGAPLLSVPALTEFVSKLLQGEVTSHLYFIFISIQFYILFPILLGAAKRWPRLVYGFIPAGFAMQWAFVLFNYYDWQLDNKGSWSLSYFSFFFTGAFLGIYYPRLKGWLAMTKENATARRAAFWLLLLGGWLTLSIIHIDVYYNQRAYGKPYHALLYELLWAFHTFFSALVMLGLSFFLYRYLPAWLSKLLYRIGQLSFGIYLIHILFLLLYDRLMPSFGAAWLHHLSYFGSWVVMLGGSWIAVSLAGRFLPFAWVLFGSMPKEGLPLQLDRAGSPAAKKSSSQQLPYHSSSS